MGRRKGGHNRKKETVVAAESVVGESNGAKIVENVLTVESPSEIAEPTQRKRITRASLNVDTAYQCQICHMRFTRVFTLRRHLDYYGDPRHPCKECGTKFTDRRQLQSHVTSAHGVPNQKLTEKCSICGQMFSRWDQLQAHLSHYHDNWTESIKPEENPAESSTEVKSAITEGPVSTVETIYSSATQFPNSRENERLCLNDESSRVLEARVVDECDSFIAEDKLGACVKKEEEYDLQTGLLDSEENRVGNSMGSENTAPAIEQCGRPQTVHCIHVKPGNGIDEDIKPLVTVCAELQEDQTPVEDKTEFQASEKICEIVPSLGAGSDVESITAASVVSQENTREHDGDEFGYKARNYEEELELRKLYSCKDCYVPLARLKIPETSGESATTTETTTQSHDQPRRTVIPSIICNQTFVSKEMMIRHYLERHLRHSDGQTLCVCGKVMNGYEALRFHFFRFCQRTVLSAAIPGDSRVPCKLLKKRLECTGCGEKFWIQSCLRSHVYNCKSFLKQKVQKILIERANIPTVTREKVCRICNSAFRSDEKLAEHTKLYSGAATCGCVFCGTMFFGERQLKCHMITAHNRNTKPGNIFECTICNQRFPEKRYQRMHTMHIHRDKVFENIRKPITPNLSLADSDDSGDGATSTNKCNVCDIVFSNEKRFIDHTIYYSKSEIIHCKTCSEQFEGQYRAHHHNKVIHYSKDMLTGFTHRCNICKEGFMYKIHLRAHVSHVHFGDANTTIAVGELERNQLESPENSGQPVDSLVHACTVCGVEFASADLLAAHEMVFTNDGEFLCNRCSRKCRTPAVLLDHVTMNHSDSTIQSGIKCHLCNENFSTQRAWVSHVKHFHSTSEPSEFYLEKNVAFNEKSRDIGYELIPTSESISSGVTYLKVKHSIDFPESPASPTDFVTNEKKINSALTESGQIISYKHEAKEGSSSKRKPSGKIIEKPEENVLIVKYSDEVAPCESVVDTRTIDVDPRKEKSATINDQQAVNLISNPGQVSVDNAERKRATSRFWRIPEAIGRISNDGGWNCGTCGYAFRGPSDLAKHMSLYSDSGPHLCEVCGRRFEVREFHRVHQISHIEPKKKDYYCAPCNEGFLKYQSMRMHTAHRHSTSPQTLSSQATDKVAVLDRQVSLESQRRSEANARQLRFPEPSTYRPVLPSIVKKSDVRTYSRKQAKQPAKVIARVDATDQKRVEMSESPHLHTEIFEDEISLTYECPNCQEGYPSIKRLNEHVASAHKSGRDEKKCNESSKNPDTDVSCDICHKVFGNNNLLNAHRKRLHFIKSVHVVKSSAPVLEITAPIDGPQNPDNAQPSVVIGRLYKLEQINILPTTVDHDKNAVRKKFTVENISRANGERQKVLPITTVQLRTPTGNVAQTPPAADTQLILQKLNMGQIVFPQPNQQNLQIVDQQNPPNAEELKNIVRITSTGSASRSVLKRIIPSDAKPIALTSSQLGRPIKIVKVESCSSVTSPSSNTVSSMIAGLATRAITSTVVSMPISTVSSKTTKTVIRMPKNSVPSKFTKAVIRMPKNSVPSKCTKTVISSPKNSVSSTATKTVIGIPTNPVSNKATKTVVGIPTNPVSNKATKTVVGIPTNPVLSEATSETVSMSISAVSNKATKTVTTAVGNCVISTASSAATSADPIKFHCQFTCNVCNIIFMNRSQFIAHNTSAHSSTSSGEHSIVNPFAEEATTTKNSVDKLCHFVSTFPRQPEVANDTNEQDPLGFESVLIPVSADDFDFFEDENLKSDEIETHNDAPKLPDEKSVPPDHRYTGPLKVRPFAKIVQNLKRKNDRRRKDDKTNDILTKRPKSVFDPVAYEELCRQHNLLPPKPISNKCAPFSNTRK